MTERTYDLTGLTEAEMRLISEAIDMALRLNGDLMDDEREAAPALRDRVNTMIDPTLQH